MTARRPLAVANWKLNGDLALVKEMSSVLNELGRTKTEVVVCPAYPFLPSFSELSQTFSLGAQNVAQFDSGAYTGEVSATMLKAFDVEYVIVGHSERRAIFAETDAIIADKFIGAVNSGLTPILCVGETGEQRDRGETESVVGAQVKAVIEKAGIVGFEQAVIAYEPVWAIGTGKTATAETAQQVHSFIRTLISQHDVEIAQHLPILYGGSVNAGNSRELFSQNDIDGGLVGGASLKTTEFLAICQSF